MMNDVTFEKLFNSTLVFLFLKSSEFNIPLHPAKCSSTLETIETSEKDVITVYKDFTDNLPPILFKKTCLSVPHSLCQIYRKIMETGIFPDDWKKAVVVPLFKKGNKSQVVNYRPVSLLSTPGKIFGTLIYKKLYIFCSPFLNDSQFGKTDRQLLNYYLFFKK